MTQFQKKICIICINFEFPFLILSDQLCVVEKQHHMHGLRTPNEGINQRHLKNWADVADKRCFGRT